LRVVVYSEHSKTIMDNEEDIASWKDLSSAIGAEETKALAFLHANVKTIYRHDILKPS